MQLPAVEIGRVLLGVEEIEEEAAAGAMYDEEGEGGLGVREKAEGGEARGEEEEMVVASVVYEEMVTAELAAGAGEDPEDPEFEEPPPIPFNGAQVPVMVFLSFEDWVTSGPGFG